MRKHGHVMFTMVYDEVKPKMAAFLRLLGNLIIVITFCMLIIPSYKYCHFVAFQKTATLRLSYYWIFLPFVYFIIAVIGYSIPEVLEDIRILRGKQKDSIVHEQSILKEVKL
jgi:TRAP-type C4-dicarboxylate transport system permease small subunit